MSTVLQIEGLTAGYDQAAVIRGVGLTVDGGEVVGVPAQRVQQFG